MLHPCEDTAAIERENTPQNSEVTVAATPSTMVTPPQSKSARKRSNSKTKNRANSSDMQPALNAGGASCSSSGSSSSSSSSSIVATRPPLPVPAWLSDVEYVNDPVIPVATRLGQEMVHYCAYTQRVMEKLELAIEDAIWSISEHVQGIWPEATVTCFGSFASGLWLPSSDVDVVVMGIPQLATAASLRTGTNNKPSKQQKQHKRFIAGIFELEQIASNLRAQPWVKQIDVVASAKVPIAKIVLAENDLRVDISIENAHTLLGIEASALVRDYITQVPVLHPLILVLKQFLREKGLNNAFTGSLSSYCIALMAFYLVERQHATDYCGADVGQLLLDFLEFYGTIFSYATTGISIKREAFGEYYLTPLVTMGANGVPLLMPQLVIDDPVYADGQHNAAAGAFAIGRVVAAFENAFYAVSFHRATKFTPSPLSQLLHWTGCSDHQQQDKAKSV